MSNLNASAEKAHFLQEKLDKMQEMHDSQKRDYQEQKKFYEDALEARTKQLDDLDMEL